jgi:hypothetical protein
MKYLCAVLMLLCAWVGMATEADLSQTVEQLLAKVEKSDATFIRNGDSHDGKAASEHMRRKYEHFKKKIKTPEDFIDLCANKSELSGKPYQIKTKDGKVMPSKDWMLERLAEIRKPAADSP